jgi:hypothetical protein
MKSAVESHKEYVANLKRDGTKTDTMKYLLVRKDASRKLMSITSKLDVEYKIADGQMSDLENIVSQKWTIQGTTDFLILQNQAQILQNMEITEVMGLVETGDINTLRALQLPIMQHQFKLNTDESRKALLTDMKSKQFLTPDQQETLAQSRAAVGVLEKVGAGLLDQSVENSRVINDIQETIVEVA